METESVKGLEVPTAVWLSRWDERWEGEFLDPSTGRKALTLLAVFAEGPGHR